jgi:DNA-directed RNA polymerase sigma subunit (sigma70/sigma32)
MVNSFRHLNEFLSDMYEQEETRLSGLLRQTGFTSAEVEMLGQAPFLETFLSRISSELHMWMVANVRMKATGIVEHHYGLFGDKPKTIAQIARRFGLTVREVEATLNETIAKLRMPLHKLELQRLVASVASEVLTNMSGEPETES